MEGSAPGSSPSWWTWPGGPPRCGHFTPTGWPPLTWPCSSGHRLGDRGSRPGHRSSAEVAPRSSSRPGSSTSTVRTPMADGRRGRRPGWRRDADHGCPPGSPRGGQPRAGGRVLSCLNGPSRAEGSSQPVSRRAVRPGPRPDVGPPSDAGRPLRAQLLWRRPGRGHGTLRRALGSGGRRLGRRRPSEAGSSAIGGHRSAGRLRGPRPGRSHHDPGGCALHLGRRRGPGRRRAHRRGSRRPRDHGGQRRCRPFLGQTAPAA